MLKTNRRTVMLAAAAGAALGFPRARAASTPYTADDLKGKLTPLGGERAGNTDGTIPTWTGGYSTLPPGYQPGDPRPIPFADETPLFSITAANLSHYQDKLSFGAIELLNRYSDFRIDVYPTHRTAIAPQYVYDYTYKNATKTQISADGNSITGAYGGTPFPIPTTGHQVIWNHLLAWKGVTMFDRAITYTGTSSGEIVLASLAEGYFAYPYYYPDGEDSFDGYYLKFTTRVLAPPYQAGGATLAMQPVNPLINVPRAWQYLPGQRRTREAPQLQYDTPNFFNSGVGNFDEFLMFYGPLDEYDFTLIGKKEMYVPYNMNKSWASSADEQFKPHFFNPDVSRWELHRVWVIEMTVKPGKRNVDARRLIYCDEDTWNGLMCDIYDSTGSLWKYIWSTPVALADIPCLLGGTTTMTYDFHAGIFATNNGINSSIESPWKPVPQLPDSYFTPGQLAALAGGE